MVGSFNGWTERIPLEESRADEWSVVLNLEPGDEFEIKLGKKAIRLIPTGAAAAHSDSAAMDDGDE